MHIPGPASNPPEKQAPSRRPLGLDRRDGGSWSTEDYPFEHSDAVMDGRLIGRVIDQRTQVMLTEARLDSWVAQVGPLLQPRLRQWEQPTA